MNNGGLVVDRNVNVYDSLSLCIGHQQWATLVRSYMIRTILFMPASLTFFQIEGTRLCAVDCDNKDLNEDVCSKYGVRGFPTSM